MPPSGAGRQELSPSGAGRLAKVQLAIQQRGPLPPPFTLLPPVPAIPPLQLVERLPDGGGGGGGAAPPGTLEKAGAGPQAGGSAKEFGQALAPALAISAPSPPPPSDESDAPPSAGANPLPEGGGSLFSSGKSGAPALDSPVNARAEQLAGLHGARAAQDSPRKLDAEGARLSQEVARLQHEQALLRERLAQQDRQLKDAHEAHDKCTVV